MEKKIILFIFLLIAANTMSQIKYEDYINAAKKGDPEAQHKVGTCYALGLGVEKDFSQMLYWYRKSADQGFAPAQCSIGYCYKNATGVPKE